MVIKLRTKIAKGSNGFFVRVPKTYIDDGNLALGADYDVTITLRQNDSAGAGDAKMSPPLSEHVFAASWLYEPANASRRATATGGTTPQAV